MIVIGIGPGCALRNKRFTQFLQKGPQSVRGSHSETDRGDQEDQAWFSGGGARAHALLRGKVVWR